MTTIVPPPPPPTPMPSAPAPPPTLTLPNPPTAMLQMALGAKLDALILQSGGNTLTLKTPFGTLSVQTGGGLVLPQGTSVGLQVQGQGTPMQLMLATVNGKPATPAVLAQAAGGGGGTGAAAGIGGAAATGVSLTLGSTVNAVLVGSPAGALARPGATPGAPAQPGAMPGAPATPGAATPGASSAATPGSPAGSPAAAGATAGANAATAAGKAGATPATSTGAQAPQAQAQQIQALLPRGTQMMLKITGIQPQPSAPTPPSMTTPGLANGTGLVGNVTGSNPTGHTLVATPAGTLALQTTKPLPPGAQIALQVVGKPTVPGPAGGVAAPAMGAAESLALNKDWPDLREAMRVLAEVSPAQHQQVMNAVLPRPDAGLTAGMVFFLAALKGGDIKKWLGEDALKILEKTRPGLAGRLGGDFETLGKRADEPQQGDWRMVHVPMAAGEGEVHQIRLLSRHHDEDEDGEGGGTRFVVDVTLTQMGRLQLDGLIRKKRKTLELIIRTESPLTPQVRDDIRGIFRDSAEITGLNGGVTFQANPPMFVEVAVPPRPAGSLGVTV